MAKVAGELEVPIAPQVAWDHASDLQRFKEWITIFEAWRSPVPKPEEIRKGLNVRAIINFKGQLIPLDWEVEHYTPPQQVKLYGRGKGLKIRLTVKVSPQGSSSKVEFICHLGGAALFGPIGSVVAKALQVDIDNSLQKYQEIFVEAS